MWPVRIQSGDEVLECMDGFLTKILKCIRFNSRIFEYTPAWEMAAFLATVTKWKCYNAVLLWNSRNILRTMKPSIKMRRADKDWFSGFGATKFPNFSSKVETEMMEWQLSMHYLDYMLI